MSDSEAAVRAALAALFADPANPTTPAKAVEEVWSSVRSKLTGAGLEELARAGLEARCDAALRRIFSRYQEKR